MSLSLFNRFSNIYDKYVVTYNGRSYECYLDSYTEDEFSVSVVVRYQDKTQIHVISKENGMSGLRSGLIEAYESLVRSL